MTDHDRGVLESKAGSKHHQNLEKLEAFPVKELDKISQNTLRVALSVFKKRLEAVIAANGCCIEGHALQSKGNVSWF